MAAILSRGDGLTHVEMAGTLQQTFQYKKSSCLGRIFYYKDSISSI